MDKYLHIYVNLKWGLEKKWLGFTHAFILRLIKQLRSKSDVFQGREARRNSSAVP